MITAALRIQESEGDAHGNAQKLMKACAHHMQRLPHLLTTASEIHGFPFLYGFKISLKYLSLAKSSI